MAWYDRFFGGSSSSSSSSNSPGHPGNQSYNNNQTGTNSQSGNNNSPGHPGNANYYYPTYNSAISPNITGVGTNVSNITGNIIDTKAEEEKNESAYLNTFMPGGNITYNEYNEGVANTAAERAEERRLAMEKAIALAYSTQQMGSGSTNPNDPNYNPDATTTEVSNFNNLTDAEKQFLIDSGFAAAESSGVLGGTFGAEIVANEAKKRFAETGDPQELLGLGYDPELLKPGGILDPYMQDAAGNWIDNPNYDPTIGYDSSAIYSFGDVENNNYLKNAYYDMQSDDLTTNKYTNYMNTIGAFGHTRPGGIKDGPNYGGYRNSGGYGGYGGYQVGLPGIMYGSEQGENRYASLPMNEFMVGVHSPMYANRGGIIDLLGDY